MKRSRRRRRIGSCSRTDFCEKAGLRARRRRLWRSLFASVMMCLSTSISLKKSRSLGRAGWPLR